MSETREIRVPDIGDFDAVDVIEILVKPGDRVAVEDGLISLESDKASMDVPSPVAGTVKEVKVSAGDKVAQGDVIALVEVEEEKGGDGGEEEEEKAEEPSEAKKKEEKEEEPEAEEEPALESEPDEDEAAPAEEEAPAPRSVPAGKKEPKPAAPKPARRTLDEATAATSFDDVYASPSIRRFARELGVDLTGVSGTGRGGRILREDVQAYVKKRLAGPAGAPAGRAGAAADLPDIDFSQWGEVETAELSKVQRLTGENTHRSWITIPHVTQHDEADVTELEAFRKGLSKEAEARGVKLTPIPFLVKAVAAALLEFPRFNASLSADGASIVLKKYVHVGIAVDTGGGLVVPVIRDADRKGLFEIAEAVADLAARARERKLKMEEMRGGSFTISSLGGIGGTAFTPVVNWPEVAILGVSKNAWKPVWNGEGFEPRLMMPLSLSYDHRAIDGAAAARFTRYLAEALGDLRRLLL